VLLASKIEEIAIPIVESKGGIIIDIEIHGSDKGKIIEVFVDNDAGMTTDLCAEISRELSRVLDLNDVFQQKYHLVVSSPGIERPLKYPRQYPKNIGRKVIVKYRGEQRVVKAEGILQAANSDMIDLQLDDDSTHKIAFDSIIETHVCAIW
jgi:ribosome maturation factor RimP